MKARQAVLTAPQRRRRPRGRAARPRAQPDPRPDRGQRRQRRHRTGRLHRHAPVAQGPEPARLEVPLPARLQRRRRGRRGRLGRDGLEAGRPRQLSRQPRLGRAADDRPRARPAVAAAGRPRRREGGLGLHRPLRPRRLDPRRHHAGPLGRGAGPRRHRPVRPALPDRRRRPSGRRHRRRGHAPQGCRSPPAPTTSSIPAAGDVREQLSRNTSTSAAPKIVADATGVPDAMPIAMSLACDGGQVVVVGSPRGKAKDVNFYDDLHRRYIEVTGRTATCCSSRPTRGWPAPGTSTRPRTGCWPRSPPAG